MNFSIRCASVIQDCIDALLPHLRDGQLLVLRSTLYPGTTDWIDAHLERKGRNLKVAFCPERIVQGHGIEELARMPQIVSGTSPEAEEEAAALFRIDRAGDRRARADRGRIRQAVQQRLSLHRICRHQSVLSDREVGRARLSAYPAGDEAQLSARQEYSDARVTPRVRA